MNNAPREFLTAIGVAWRFVKPMRFNVGTMQRKLFDFTYGVLQSVAALMKRTKLSRITITTLSSVALVGCLSFILPDPKAIPPAISHNVGLEQAAIKTIMSSGINADPVEARVISQFRVEQNKYTGLPTKRYINIVVVVRSRAVKNTCTWGAYRFSQRYMERGGYERGLRKVIALDSGSVNCDTMKP